MSSHWSQYLWFNVWYRHAVSSLHPFKELFSIFWLKSWKNIRCSSYCIWLLQPLSRLKIKRDEKNTWVMKDLVCSSQLGAMRMNAKFFLIHFFARSASFRWGWKWIVYLLCAAVKLKVLGGNIKRQISETNHETKFWWRRCCFPINFYFHHCMKSWSGDHTNNIQLLWCWFDVLLVYMETKYLLWL